MEKILILLFSINASAATWYVSPTGSGIGSIGSPWGLQQALTNASVAAGDLILLRQGIYFPNTTNSQITNEPTWSVLISGSAVAQTVITCYTNEHAAIDRPWYFFEGSGTNLTFKNLEFFDSLKGYHTNVNFPNGPWDEFNNKNNLNGNQWINCLVHDMDNCWNSESIIRGCIIWHIGVNALEHVCYPAGTTVTGNICLWQTENFINFNDPNGTVVRSNIIAGGGNTVGGTEAGDVAMGQGNCDCSYNCFYNNLGVLGGADKAMSFAGITNTTLTVNNNHISNHDIFIFPEADTFGTVSVQNNTAYCYGGDAFVQVTNTGTWTINNNSYTSSTTNTVTFDQFITHFYTFAQWKANNPTYDTSSTSTNGVFPPDSVVVYPNQDQPKRCHIAVYNYSGQNNVMVNLSSVLNSNDFFWVYNAQNYLIGPIMMSNFSGTTISLPMTNLSQAPVLYGTNAPFNLTNPPPLNPTFGVFVVEGFSQAQARVHL